MPCNQSNINPCPIYPDAKCVVYTGGNLPNSGIVTNDRLSSILLKIDNAIGSGGGGTISPSVVKILPGIDLYTPITNVLIQKVVFVSPSTFTFSCGTIFGFNDIIENTLVNAANPVINSDHIIPLGQTIYFNGVPSNLPIYLIITQLL